MPTLSKPFISLLSFLLLFPAVSLSLNVSVSTAQPSAAFSISPSFLSFSIEQDRWTDWVGTTSRNQIFFNTLDNLIQITGEPPHIRIGANSEDHTDFSDSVKFSEAIFPAVTSTVPYPEATNITVGDGFYEAAQFLPPNTHVTWGLNLGQNNLTAAVLEAKSLAKAFSSPSIKSAGIILDAIEIGNEVDLYSNNGLRPKSYTSTQYVKEWTTFATNVTAAISSFPISPKFWGGAFAGSSHSTSGFSPQAIFAEGVLSSSAGALISTISEHRYSGSFCSGSGGLLQDLMTKSTIRSNLTQFSPDVAATQAKGLDFVLGETNSYSCHGAPGVSNTAGAALWTLDYLLFASQLGILRVFFHEGIGFKYNLIQPLTLTRSILDGTPLSTPLPPHIQPQYYAAIIAGEAIGNSGNTHVTELDINNARVSGYAFYEGKTLARVVLINSQAFFTTTTTPRTSTHIDLNLSGTNAPTTMTVKRLSVPHADDTTGLTWGGQTYETSNARVSGTLQVTKVAVTSGVDIQETEVVMLTF
ncbi:glycoside hydrolase family 79 protein [Pholiota conissans]|uniref:Glycoside hydrolase family 79 protein n=1 Tax=Pholiota conissans TaxID=109636 RepID=A0A9P5YP25_9AGAR|nr:glycoside hydrolase family 79 protein [Pholiota conissans]